MKIDLSDFVLVLLFSSFLHFLRFDIFDNGDSDKVDANAVGIYVDDMNLYTCGIYLYSLHNRK